MARKQISLLALWDDPDLATLSAPRIANMQITSAKIPPSRNARAEEDLSKPYLLVEFLRARLSAQARNKMRPSESKIHPERPVSAFTSGTGKNACAPKLFLWFFVSAPREKAPPQFHRHTVAGRPPRKSLEKIRQLLEEPSAANTPLVLRRSKCLRRDSAPPLGGNSGSVRPRPNTRLPEAPAPIPYRLLELFLRIPHLKVSRPLCRQLSRSNRAAPHALKFESSIPLSGHLL